MAEHDVSYPNWQSIAQAIKAEASRTAKEHANALNINEQIAQANHDRFLSRVFVDGERSEWLLKGGTAMLARVPNSRPTKDLDLAATAAADLDAAQAALERAAARDLGDHLQFRLTNTKNTGLGQNQPGVETRRLTFTAHDTETGRKLFDVPIDVVVGPPPVGKVHTLEPSNRLHLKRPLQTSPYRMFPIADQIAEKVTATIDTYAGRPSSRVKDLVDLVTIARTQRVDLRELQTAITGQRTLSQTPAFTEFTVPESWNRSFPPLAAKSTEANGYDLKSAVGLVKQLVDPALVAEPVRDGSVWTPGRGWSKDAAVAEASGAGGRREQARWWGIDLDKAPDRAQRTTEDGAARAARDTAATRIASDVQKDQQRGRGTGRDRAS